MMVPAAARVLAKVAKTRHKMDGLIMGIIGVIIWLMGFINLLTKSP